MIKTITEYDFRHAFETIRPDNFDYEAQGMLFEYLEQLEYDMCEQIELDVIAICYEFVQDSPENIISDYSIDMTDYDEESDNLAEMIVEYLQDRTSVVGIASDNTIIYQSF